MTSIGLAGKGSGAELRLFWSDSAPATLALRGPGADVDPAPSAPLVEALAAGEGRTWSGPRYVDSAIGGRLRYVRHEITRSGPWQRLGLTQYDATTGLEFTSRLAIHDEEYGLRSVTQVTNRGADSVVLHAVSSLVFADFGAMPSLDSMTLLRGRSDWLAEGRWAERPLREAGLPRLNHGGRPFRTRGCIEATSVSSWSSAVELPAGVLSDRRSGRRWSFQIEHNGGWLWQVGELAEGLYLALLGPTDEQHHWQLELAPGDTFETVPASIALESELASLAGLTNFRRATTAAARDRALPVVFNDYMNTVNGDPTADVLHPLIDSAAEVGAEYFVIDAGWYADDGDWWSTVGEWQPSTRRFPDGLPDVLDHVRRRGMVPGLWLEPEVVGVESPMAFKLPDSAFLWRGGVRVTEHGRYHLDFTSAAASSYLDEVVDRLVNDLGVGYFKFDYNVRAGVGSDAATPSAGHGLLLHNRAYLSWVDRLRRRHPDLVLENCASGGMRQDFATVSRFDLQSTSDQEDLHAYAAVAAAAPMLVLPEQAGNWAYPQAAMSHDDVVFTLSTGVLGRLYLSGWLDRLDHEQRGLVAQAVTAHKALRDRLPGCTPCWPLGLPGWDDEWIALALQDRVADGVADTAADAHHLYLTVWRRSRQPGRVSVPLPAPPTGCRWAGPSAVFPEHSPLAATLSEGGHALDVVDEQGRQAARVLTLRAVPYP